MAKNYDLVSLLSVVSKVWKVDHVTFWSIPSMVLGLLDQLQIFWQLYLMELVGLSVGLGLLELLHF